MAPWLIGWALLLCAQVIITSGPTGSGKSLLASTVATRIGAVDILDADGKARVAPPRRRGLSTLAETRLPESRARG